MKLLPYGESALFLDLELDDAKDRARRTHAVASALRRRLPGADVVVGTGVVVIAGASGRGDLERVVEDALAANEPPPAGRLHRIATTYDGPDLDAVAAATGLSRDEVIARHAGREYVVELVGFLPGFAYAGPLDARLVLPRRPAPRARVPAGSVAIAGAQTGIYPFASPGGWHLIGRATGVVPFDPARDPPGLFAPGDRLRFEPTRAA